MSKPPKLRPCKKCGSTDIQLRANISSPDHVYAGGFCKNCEAQHFRAFNCEPATRVLADVWNHANTLTVEEKQEIEIKKLKAQIRKLQRKLKDRLPHWNPDNLWEEHPHYPVEDWQYEVGEDNTRCGYIQWVNNQIENQANEQTDDT